MIVSSDLHESILPCQMRSLFGSATPRRLLLILLLAIAGCRSVDDAESRLEQRVHEAMKNGRGMIDVSVSDVHCEIVLSGQHSLEGLEGLPVTSLATQPNAVLEGWKGISQCPITDLRIMYPRTPITNIAFLADLPLKVLALPGSKVADLSRLEGMKLEILSLRSNPVTDLKVLRGMPLQYLDVAHTQVDDLSPLLESPLEALEIPRAALKGIHLLKRIPTLQTVKCDGEVVHIKE